MEIAGWGSSGLLGASWTNARGGATSTSSELESDSQTYDSGMNIILFSIFFA